MTDKLFDRHYLIYGLHSIIEAIKSGQTIEKILIKKQFTSNLMSELRQLAKQHNIPIQYVPVDKLNRITKRNHQGAIAFISPVPFWDLEEIVTRDFEQGRMPLLVMLDRVTDVRNFGAIVRTAECAGLTGIIVPIKNSAQISGDAMKTSAGALNYVPIIRENNLADALVKLKNMGFQAIAASEKADKYYFEIDFTKPTVIIMGAEDTGISHKLLKISDQIVKIPILGHLDSLNVSVAAGILIYAAVEQRIRAKI
jgi:23S rRNA (guanosine2251-2'-O)-methyltransferase